MLGEGDDLGRDPLQAFKLTQVGSAPLQRWSLEGPRELNGAPGGGSRETGSSWGIQCGQSQGDHPALRAVGVGCSALAVMSAYHGDIQAQ